MDREAILGAIADLARSQGFYGRLLRAIEEVREEDEARYEELMKTLEAQNFGDTVDMVLYFET